LIYACEGYKKNIFLTGHPSSGKTTVIKKVIKKLGIPANGFYTEEERAAGKRLGLSGDRDMYDKAQKRFTYLKYRLS